MCAYLESSEGFIDSTLSVHCLSDCFFVLFLGDIGDSFYLIASGEVSVQVNHIQVGNVYLSFFKHNFMMSFCGI
jgi:hypothetical protein